MAKQSKTKIQAKNVQGLKYLKVLQPLLESLHDRGCQRDKAGNRQLHTVGGDRQFLLAALVSFTER